MSSDIKIRDYVAYIRTRYGSGSRFGPEAFQRSASGYCRIRAPKPVSKMGEQMLSMCVQSRACAQDFAQVEARMNFAAAAGETLAAVSADPRNHFGKHALRRFDK